MALTDGLISYWKLDEASGDALDAHGTNHLPEIGTVPAASGKINGARDFERTVNAYFQIASNATLETGDIDFTFAAWVQLESKPGGGNAMYVAAKADGFLQDEWAVVWASTDVLQFYINFFAVGVSASNFGSPPLATWIYIVCWHDSAADTINIQVNNGLVNSAPTGGSAPTAGTAEFSLGSYDGILQIWDGLIDEAAFWKRVLTSQERTALYNNGDGLAYPFAVALNAQNHRGTGRPPNP